MSSADERFWVVLAWVESSYMGASLPTLRKTHAPSAAVWLRDGELSDVEKAREYGAELLHDRDFWMVVSLEASHEDPLGRAREVVMREFVALQEGAGA